MFRAVFTIDGPVEAWKGGCTACHELPWQAKPHDTTPYAFLRYSEAAQPIPVQASAGRLSAG